MQEVEVKVLRWLHDEEATGVQYLEVSACHVLPAKRSLSSCNKPSCQDMQLYEWCVIIRLSSYHIHVACQVRRIETAVMQHLAFTLVKCKLYK